MKVLYICSTFLYSYILAQATPTDTQSAINSIKQNNLIIAILSVMVLILSFVVAKLWIDKNQRKKERIEDIKQRLIAEENIRKEMQQIYNKLNKTNDGQVQDQ